VAVALAAALAGAVPALAGDEDGKTADQVLADAVAALRALPGMRVTGSTTDKVDHGTTTIEGVVSASGDGRITARHARQTLRVIVVGTHEYLRAPAAFWRDTGFSHRKARRLAHVWVRIAIGGDQPDPALTPARLASCLERAHGTLSLAGTEQVASAPAVVVADAGDVKGSAPERIAVADATPAVPLRLTLTGPRRKGAPADADCDPNDETVANEDLRLTALSVAPKITMPKHAKTLRQLVGRG
jgi:hypothetical protein